MAERRMFAKTIIDSDTFLDMPLSSQALYFHFSMRADDDGFINNPRKIQRMIGASENDVDILTRENFIIPFETGIVVIKHWKIHNYIQSDRYKPTVYQTERTKLKVESNKSYTLDDTFDSISDTNCIHDVYSLETQDNKVNKDSIGEDSISTSSSDDDQRVDYQSVVELYNSICISRPKVKTLTDKRKTAIRKRLFEVGGDMSELQKVFEAVEISDFLSGRSGKWDGCSFDWIMKSDNFVRIREGNYTNQNNHTKYDYSDVSRYVGTSMDV